MQTSRLSQCLVGLNGLMSWRHPNDGRGCIQLFIRLEDSKRQELVEKNIQ